MHVEAGEHIDAGAAQVEGIEHRAQVNVERIIPLTGEHTESTLQFIESLRCQTVVVGHRARTHVRRDHNQVLA